MFSASYHLQGITNISNLYIGRNDITSSSLSLLMDDNKTLNNLNELSLHQNKLDRMPVLTSCPNLQLLRLENNYLTQFPDIDSIGPAIHLRYLQIDLNDLHTWPSASEWGPFMELEEMYLNHAGLTQIATDALLSVPNILILWLSENDLENLPNFSLVGSSLEELVLTDCNIDEMPPEYLQGMAQLQRLYLDHNRLSYFPTATLRFMPHLQILSLTYNHMVALENLVAMAPLPSNMTVDLAGNPWACDWRMCWIVTNSDQAATIVDMNGLVCSTPSIYSHWKVLSTIHHMSCQGEKDDAARTHLLRVSIH